MTNYVLSVFSSSKTPNNENTMLLFYDLPDLLHEDAVFKIGLLNIQIYLPYCLVNMKPYYRVFNSEQLF